jgi:hypothetical protein
MPFASAEDSQDNGRESSRDYGLATALFIGGSILLASFANDLIFSALPLRITSAQWQLRIVSNLLSTGVNALIGLLLIAISQQSLNKQMATKASLIRKLAAWAAIGYLILIPGQIAAGVRLLGQTAEAERRPFQQWAKIRTRILASETEAQLRDLLRSLPTPPDLPEKFDTPLPKLKKDIVSVTDARFAALYTEAEKARSQRLQTFILEAIRNSILSLLLAAGFSAASNKSAKRTFMPFSKKSSKRTFKPF